MIRSTLAARHLLLFTLGIGIVGTAAELLLLGHVEGWQQMVPVALLAISAVAVAVQVLRPTVTSSLVLHGLMLLFLVTGPIGVALHFQGNEEFEREMYPKMEGFELIQKTMTGATPVLAPGTMALLGLVGIAYIRLADDASRRD